MPADTISISDQEFVINSIEMLSQVSGNDEKETAVVEFVNAAAQLVNIDGGNITELHDYKCDRCNIGDEKYDEGYNKGVDEGHEAGYEEGKEEGYADGKDEALNSKNYSLEELLNLLGRIAKIFTTIEDDRIGKIKNEQLKIINKFLTDQAKRFEVKEV